MCPFRGRVSFRVYIKGKPHKYGIKVYDLCDAETGMICEMEVYTGKCETDPSFNTMASLVQRLLCNHVGKGYTVYMDRYFTSPALFQKLHDQQINATGTIQVNRLGKGNPVRLEKLQKGEKISACKGNV